MIAARRLLYVMLMLYGLGTVTAHPEPIMRLVWGVLLVVYAMMLWEDVR